MKWEDNFKMELRKVCVRCKLDGNNSESCLMTDFGNSGVEASSGYGTSCSNILSKIFISLHFITRYFSCLLNL